MKNLLKKLKENWVDYLVIFISVLTICFVYLFTAFYQPKENNHTVNKENIIKVLRDKKNAQEGNFKSEMAAFYIGTMSPYNTNNSFIEFYININYIDVYFYEDTYPDNLEIEIEYYITATTKYLDNVGMQTNATFNPSGTFTDAYSFTTQGITSVEELESVYLYFDMKELEYENGYDSVDIYFDMGMYYEMEFMFNNIDSPDFHFGVSDIYTSFGIDASNLPESVKQQIDNNIFSDINDVNANYSIKDFKIYFNTINAGYSNGYDSGWDKGYESGFDYGQELGYNNGYNDGVIAGSSDFNILNFIRALFDLIWGVLSVEMLPNIKLIYIVAIPLVLSVIKFILGWFR